MIRRTPKLFVYFRTNDLNARCEMRENWDPRPGHPEKTEIHGPAIQKLRSRARPSEKTEIHGPAIQKLRSTRSTIRPSWFFYDPAIRPGKKLRSTDGRFSSVQFWSVGQLVSSVQFSSALQNSMLTLSREKERWLLWRKSLKNVVATAEIPKKGGCYGYNPPWVRAKDGYMHG